MEHKCLHSYHAVCAHDAPRSLLPANQVQHARCDRATTYATMALHGTRLCWLQRGDDLLYHDVTAETARPDRGRAAGGLLVAPRGMAWGFGVGGDTVAGGDTLARRQGRQHLIGSEECINVPWPDV